MAERPLIDFLLDNNVPESVGRWLDNEGTHTVVRVREQLMHDATDDQIAAMADENDLVIITWDRDFRRYLPQVLQAQPGGVSGGVVRIRTREENAATRVADTLDLVEFHFGDARARNVRLRLDLGQDYATLHDLENAAFADLQTSLRFHYERAIARGYLLNADLAPHYWKFNERRLKRTTATR